MSTKTGTSFLAVKCGKGDDWEVGVMQEKHTQQ